MHRARMDFSDSNQEIAKHVQRPADRNTGAATLVQEAKKNPTNAGRWIEYEQQPA